MYVAHAQPAAHARARVCGRLTTGLAIYVMHAARHGMALSLITCAADPLWEGTAHLWVDSQPTAVGVASPTAACMQAHTCCPAHIVHPACWVVNAPGTHAHHPYTLDCNTHTCCAAALIRTCYF